MECHLLNQSSIDALIEMSKIVTDSEQNDILTNTHSDTLLEFLKQLFSISHLELKLDGITLILSAETKLKKMQSEFDLFHRALDPIQSSSKLPTVLWIILKLGNYLNSRSQKGNAYGYRLSSLGLLNGVKCINKKQRFLSLLIENI